MALDKSLTRLLNQISKEQKLRKQEEESKQVPKRYNGKAYGPVKTRYECPVCKGNHSKKDHINC